MLVGIVRPSSHQGHSSSWTPKHIDIFPWCLKRRSLTMVPRLLPEPFHLQSPRLALWTSTSFVPEPQLRGPQDTPLRALGFGDAFSPQGSKGSLLESWPVRITALQSLFVRISSSTAKFFSNFVSCWPWNNTGQRIQDVHPIKLVLI